MLPIHGKSLYQVRCSAPAILGDLLADAATRRIHTSSITSYYLVPNFDTSNGKMNVLGEISISTLS